MVERDATGEEGEELAQSIARIVDRIASNEFPAVLPADQRGLSQSEAELALTWVQKVDAVRIQSYVDEQWKLFRQDNPSDEDKPEPVRRAEWCRDCYYVHLREFVQHMEPTRSVYDAVLVLVGAENVDEWTSAALRDACARVDPGRTQDLIAFFENEWKSAWSGLPAFCRGEEAEMARQWRVRECAAVVEKFARESDRGSSSGAGASDTVFEAVVGVVGGDVLDAETRGRLRESCSRVDPLAVEDLMGYVSRDWARVWASIPEFCRRDERSMELAWLAKECVGVVDAFVTQAGGTRTPDDFRFAPEIDVKSLPCGDQREEAERLVARVERRHVDPIRKAVDTQYQEALVCMPEFARTVLGDDCRRRFLEQRYFDIVAQVLGSSGPASTFRFEPQVAIDDAEGPESAQDIEAAVSRVTEDMAPMIERAVEEAWAQDLRRCSAVNVSGMVDVMKTRWMKERYFGIVIAVARSREEPGCRASEGSVGDGGADRGHIFAGDMFASPKKRARTGSASKPAAPPVRKNVLDIQGGTAVGGARVEFHGLVLHCPDEPRWVGVENRRTKTHEDVPVLTVLLADSAGPMLAEAWRQEAIDAVMGCVGNTHENCDVSCGICVTNCVVRAEKGPSFPALKKLSLDQRSVVRLLSAGERNSLRGGPADTSGVLLLRNMTAFAHVVPWRASVVGVVSRVEEESESASGVPLRAFTLQDGSGQYVSCVALGRHASSVFLAVRNELACYFARGLQGLGNSPGQLWLYDDAHIVLRRANVVMPSARAQIEMR